MIVAAGIEPLPAVVDAQETERAALGDISSWGYQLQRVNPAVYGAMDYDLVVVDYSRDGSDRRAFSNADVTQLRTRPDGTSRVVLSYLSIGEAEDYRYYWRPALAKGRPSWLKPENPEWPGNFPVRYWDPAWQAIIFGSPQAYLDKILDAGFDGVYLDRIDAYDEADPTLDRRARMRAMIAFVGALADYARAKKPGFLIVAQNGEELLAEGAYRSVIDGLGKEDLFFGVDGDNTVNGLADVRASIRYLNMLKDEGKPVLLVEYVSRPELVETARHNAETLGVPLFIGARALDSATSL